jgi:hypothetical protein
MNIANFYFVNQATNVARQRAIATFMWLGLGATSLFLFFFRLVITLPIWLTVISLEFHVE